MNNTAIHDLENLIKDLVCNQTNLIGSHLSIIFSFILFLVLIIKLIYNRILNARAKHTST